MTSKFITFRNLMTVGFLCFFAFVAASCSDDSEADNRLPDGKYPMTFTAAVEGLVATRATTENSWEGDEEVAIQISNTEPKKYKAASDGNLSVESGEPFYWQSTSDIKVNAWYPYNNGSKPDDSALTVKADQNTGTNYQASDYLEVTDATVTFQNPALTFKHRTAKVVVTLVKGEGITDLSNASVTFVNQTGVEGSGNTVAPKAETSGTTGSLTTYTALLVPQQMQDQKFIKVTLGTGDAARDYYYTPTNNTDANLEAGKQYTYTITVKKEGLQVQSVSASWTDENQDGDAEQATFKVHLPSGHRQSLTLGSELSEDADNNCYTINNNGNSFSLSYTVTDDNKMKGFPIMKGIGNWVRTVATDDFGAYVCTFTYSDLRSDIWLTYTSYMEIGDYYYSDNTWSPVYDNSSSPACIGIVFKVGAANDDKAENYDSKLTDNTIHGYVVALEDAHTDKCGWGGVGVVVGTSTNQDDFAGYSNTKKIIEKAIAGEHLKPDHPQNDYPAAYYISEYKNKVKAPECTSGWYFPSTGQLKELYEVKDNIHTDVLKLQSDDYLSSSEYARGYIAYNVGFVSFQNGESGYKEKNTACYVRAILTF